MLGYMLYRIYKIITTYTTYGLFNFCSQTAFSSKLPCSMDKTMILLQLKNCMPSGHFSPNTLLITLFYFQIPYSLFPVAFINSLYTWEYYYIYIASFLKWKEGILDKREKDTYLFQIFYNLECMHIYVNRNFLN